MTTRFHYDHVLSLGPDCQAALQAKKFFRRAQCVTTPLSFQITAFSTIVEYFDKDFRGFLEREDLEETTYKDRCRVRNLRYGTLHPHEFPHGLASYSSARSRHDYLCSKFRRLLQSDESILFLYGSDHMDQARQLENVIATYNPRLRFRLIAARSPVLSNEWSRRGLAEWQHAAAEANKAWGRSGIFFEIKMQLRRLAHHAMSKRFETRPR